MENLANSLFTDIQILHIHLKLGNIKWIINVWENDNVSDYQPLLDQEMTECSLF